MDVLVIDVGGTHVKILATGQKQSREFRSGPTLTAKQMVVDVKKLAEDWKYNAVSIGYPGPVINNRPLTDPWNLVRGWAGFDFEAAFMRPVKVVNDAAMMAALCSGRREPSGCRSRTRGRDYRRRQCEKIERVTKWLPPG